MNFLLLALILTLVAFGQAEWTAEQREKFDTADTECIDETKIDPAIPPKMRKGIFGDDDDKLKEYVLCVNKKLGFMNEAGEFQSDAIKTFMGDNQEANERFQKCINHKETPQERALEWAKCLTKGRN